MPLPTPKLDHKPPGWFKEGFNPRPIVRDDYFLGLVGSIDEHGVLQPPGAREDGRKLWGNYRIAASIEAGLKLIPVLIFPNDLTEGQAIALTLVENLQHKAQTDYETFVGIDRLEKTCPDLQRKDIARLIGKSAGMVTNYLSARDLIPEALEAFREDKIGITKVYKLANSDNQAGLLALFLSGQSREEAVRQVKRSASTPTERISRIKVPLVSGATVIIASEAVSMEEALEATLEAAKQIKAAIAKGIQAKSAQAYWRDVAAAG